MTNHPLLKTFDLFCEEENKWSDFLHGDEMPIDREILETRYLQLLYLADKGIYHKDLLHPTEYVFSAEEIEYVHELSDINIKYAIQKYGKDKELFIKFCEKKHNAIFLLNRQQRNDKDFLIDILVNQPQGHLLHLFQKYKSIFGKFKDDEEFLHKLIHRHEHLNIFLMGVQGYDVFGAISSKRIYQATSGMSKEQIINWLSYSALRKQLNPTNNKQQKRTKI